jgi:zinc protease
MPARPALTVAVSLAAAVALPSASPAQVTDWKEIRKPALRAFQPQQPRRLVLGNGLVIFLQEDHELPLIQGTLRIRGGSREEDPKKVGLVSVYGQAWRTGGTRTRTGDQLDDALEARAARLETSGGQDSTTVSFNCLKETFPEVFDVFLELVRAPEFRPDKIELAKNQLNTGIARRNDSPQSILFRESAKLAYGADSPYGRHSEYATVAAVTRDDLLAWHKAYVHPNNMILGLVGDFDSRAMEATLRKALASWPRGPAARKVEASFPGPTPGVYFVQKDDVNQSFIRLVHMGTRTDDPEYYALTVMNEVFGGSFASRLFTNVRSKKGLAYAVGGAVGTSFDYPGLFSVFTATKSGTTAAAIDALYEEIDNLKKSPATAEELQRGKESILNSFVFRLDSKAKVLNEKMTYEFYGYPSDFLERFQAGIERVGAEDVARVARKYIERDKLAVVVVGRAADFDRPLSSFGKVTTIDVTIPERR